MSKVTKESNATGFSLENKTVEDFASYNLINESNKISFFDINDLTINDASNNLRQIYNPLMSATTLTVDNKQFETYGFFQKYVNDNYTNNPLSLEWPNIVFSKNGDSLSIVVQSTNPNYKNRVSDIFTLYSNILPPSPSEVDKTKYEVFFNQNIYSFNPWSLFIDSNNSMKTNDFDFALIEGFNSDNDINENILYNHGIFDDFYSYIVGTNLTFLDEVSMQSYKNELTKIDSEVSLAKTWNDAFINNSKHLSSTNNFADYQSFSDFILKWVPDLGEIYLSNIYSEKYYEFLNKLSTNIKDNFMQNTKTFEFNYQINVENSTGLSKFFSDIYYNKNNKFHNQVKNIFTEADKKYFSGSFNIPLIPFITVLPSNDNLSLDETKIWASNYNNYTDPNKSIINYSNLNSIVNKTFNKLSEKSNSFFSELLNSSKVSKEIRSEYYKNYDIEYFLSNEMGMDFTKSSNFTLTDTNSNSFIMSKSKYFSENKVNNIVLYEGAELIDAKIYENYLNGIDILDKYKEWINVLNSTSPPAGYNSLEEYQKEYFLNNNEFFITMNLFNQSKLLTNIDIVNSFYSLVSNIINIKLMNENFEKWKSETLKFLNTFEASLVSWNGAGYNFEFTRTNDMGIRIDLVANYYEPSSYMAIVGLNYSQLKNNNKKIIDSEFAQQACKLPYKSREITDNDLLNNYEKYQNHYIYNPYSEKVEFYNDFLDWMSRLDSQYKINISGDEFVILGKGITTEFVYPIVSNNQLLINNNSPVIFTNELGYDKVFLNYGIQQTTNYFVNFKHKFDYLQNNEDLKRVNNWTSRVNNEKLAYRLNDPTQPNQLLYLRINFPSSILNIVLIITIFIGAIIVLLSLTFIFVLMKSIIKQNLNTFAVGMANGISKRKLLFSFMPFVLIPSSIAAILGYSLSFFIYPLISNSIQDYWILEYIKFSFSPGYLILVFLIITLIIFSVQSIVVFSVLNKNVSTLLVSKLEFKHNKLIQLSHKSASKLKPLSSFRITYMLGNFGRLLLLLLMMTSFVSLTTIFASTTNTFTTAVSKTVQNKKYNYAIDLYSPSEQGGYYYNIPYNLLGSRQQGLTSLYDLNSPTGFYNSDYKDDLTYNIPGTDKSVVYENLFLPSASLIGDVQGNLTFFRNRIFNMATMDFGINFVGNYINPWDWAKKVIPNNMVNTIVEKQQEQLNYAFAYVCSIQDDLNNPDRDMWIWDKSNPNSFKENLHNSSNPEEWSQDNWIFQYVKEDSKYVWKSNEQLLSTGLPNFTMTQSVVYFVTRLISLSQNPNYLKFIENLEKAQDIKVLDNNYMLALNVVPVVDELDETYTYINANAKVNNKELNNIKIYGIKSNSDQIVLWDENNNVDLKQILQNYELNNNLEQDVYP
ncbi:MAG: ABC transporter permease, partial [Ureaplasma sp.]|nr:ABC transporter permease [Ureaplasma sp.]